MKFDVEPGYIRNILTLRYDPSENHNMVSLSLNDFQNINTDYNPVAKVESILQKSIDDFFSERKPNCVTLALSGGIDSLTVLSVLRNLFPELKIICLSAAFDEESKEVKAAKENARLNECDFQVLILDNFLQNLPKQISIVGDPKWHYYWYFIAKKAKQFSDILITGDGGDELFGGYVFRYKKFLDITEKNTSWQEKAQAYLECHNRDWVPEQQLLFGDKIQFHWNDIFELFRKHFDNSLEPLNQVFLADFNGKLRHDWIPALNKIHSHFEMEGFSPFLNSELIKYSASIPINKKYDYNSNKGKLILREYLKQKGIKFSDEKSGFSPNLFQFWKLYGTELINKYLIDGFIIKENWISKNWLNSAIQKANIENDIRYINKLLSVLSLEIWFKLFITKEINENQKL